jgi:hypothetical protein
MARKNQRAKRSPQPEEANPKEDWQGARIAKTVKRSL